MSQIIEVVNNSQKKIFTDFICSVYKDDPKYRDINLLFVKNFLYQKDTYSKRCRVIPVMVSDPDIKVVGMYVHSKDSTELKLSFLEFKPNSISCLRDILAYGQALARKENLSKIIIGINGHISYGLGILCNQNNEFEFMGNYNPAYYVEELDKLHLVTKKAFSYKYSTDNKYSQSIMKEPHQDYTFRTLNLNDFKHDMLIFGDICQKSFPGTPYYSPLTPGEMLDVMSPLKPLLKSNDIVFAQYHGKEIGFVFTHPDYAQFFNSRHVNLVWVFLHNLLSKSTKIIVNSIGIVPEHRHKALASGLLGYASHLKKGTFKQAVSSFVLTENLPSTKISTLFSTGINREYNLYEVEVA
jgi:hypothetical protein